MPPANRRLELRDLPPWRPEALSRRRPFLVARGRILAALRRAFEDLGLTEVETPALQVSPGLEPNLTAFATDLVEAGTATRRRLHLHTSPEFAMKKLLAAGTGPIFQFARAYRNGERSDTHHPEFTMLEWYRPGAGYRDLIDDCAELLRVALAAAGRPALQWRDRSATTDRVETITVVDAFRHHAGIDLMASLPATGPDRHGLARQAAEIGIRTAAGDDWDDIFFRIFLERIEPRLGSPHPTVLIDYPVHMAALARPRADDPRFCERFELYVCGLELANAFGELTDADEQRRRFERDRATRQARSGEAYPIDEDFLAALAFGLPPSAGIALGFDRLVMLATGATRIEDVLWLPVAG